MTLFKPASKLVRSLPVLRTGWFYLWVGLMLLIFWSSQHHYWRVLENINLAGWQDALLRSPGNTVDASRQTIRITDIRLDANGLKKIKRVAKKHPKATFALLGDYTHSFINGLKSLKYSHLSTIAVLMGKSNSNSLNALSLGDKNSAFHQGYFSLSASVFNKASQVKWLALENMQMAFQPPQSFVGQSVVWQIDGSYYPSFVAQSVILNLLGRTVAKDTLKLNFKQGVDLQIGTVSYPLGLYGEIIPAQKMLLDKKSSDLLAESTSKFQGIIIIDDLSIENSHSIAASIAALAGQSYLYSNLITKITELIFAFLLVLIIYQFGRFHLAIKTLLSLSVVALLFSSQYFFIELSLWLSIDWVFMVAFVSYLVQAGYARESFFLLQNGTPKNENRSKKAKKTNKKKLKGNDTRSEEIRDTTIVINTLNQKPSLRPNFNVLQLEKFGRYEVNGILGKGAMGVVFQGLDPKINRSVAIKTLQLSEQIDNESLQDTKERFFREAETAGNLSHANIVTIYDVGEEKHPGNNQLLGYIAMDLLTGKPLSEHVVKKTLLSQPLVYQLMIQMTDALEYAHNQNVIHRDIKPANIIYDNILKRGTLTDFGIAHLSDHSKTKTGTIIGSPYYMSPEQIVGLKIDNKSDIFSLGVTFYQLLSGKLPFTGDSIASVAYHIAETKQVSVRQKNKKLYSSAARITNKALQKDKRKRYQSMQEFKQALINALKRDYKKSPLQ